MGERKKGCEVMTECTAVEKDYGCMAADDGGEPTGDTARGEVVKANMEDS